MHRDFDSDLLAARPATNAFEGADCNRNRQPEIFPTVGDDFAEGGALYLDDLDQKIPEQLLACEPPYHSRATTAPGRFSPALSSSHSNLSLSPAAMFLSAFNPPLSASDPLPDDEGQCIAGHRLGPVVGRGAFSTIRTASSPSGDTVAVKIVCRRDVVGETQKQLDYEAGVWAMLHHEHILPLFTSEHTPYADFFITQYCPAGSLFDILKRDGCPALPHEDVGTMFRQVVRGLQYMHEVAGYVHGDIKLENVLVDDMGVCKIGDFGMAKKIGESHNNDLQRTELLQSHRLAKHGLHAHSSLRHNKQNSSMKALRHRNSINTHTTPSPDTTPVYQQGSLPYAAPELLLPQSSVPWRPHPAQDIWALGVLLYGLLTGQLPFVDALDYRLQMKILHGRFEMPMGIGSSAKRVLQGCLNMSVTNRWTIAMVDEVAWGIGWSEEDSVSTSGASCRLFASRSRSRARDHRRFSPPTEHPRNRTASLSSSRSSSRSIPPDYPRHISASLSASTTYICGISSDHVCTSSSTNIEKDRERGRRLTKTPMQFNSRSPSSIAPMTPPDTADGSRSFLGLKSRIILDELSPDSGEYRGRRRFSSSRARNMRTTVELADIDEDSRRFIASTPGPEGYSRLHGIVDKRTRAGSVPPCCGTFHESSWHRVSKTISKEMGTRSRSVGFEPETPLAWVHPG